MCLFTRTNRVVAILGDKHTHMFAVRRAVPVPMRKVRSVSCQYVYFLTFQIIFRLRSLFDIRADTLRAKYTIDCVDVGQ